MALGLERGNRAKACSHTSLCELAIEIPGDKLPPDKYRNRLLTREEVEAIWPQVKERQN
jgi:hypothetical protein